jgi:hypothetical protein
MVGPGRNWSPHADGWPAVQERHGLGDAVKISRHSRRDDGKRTSDYFVRGAPKWWEFEKRRRTQLKFSNVIRNRGMRQELRLGSKKIFHEALGQSHELEVVKRAVGISIELRRVSDWTLWRCWSNSKRKKRRPKHNSRKRTKMMMVHFNSLGNRSSRAALRRDKQEQFENNHAKKWATVKVGEAEHRRQNTVLGKEGLAVCL